MNVTVTSADAASHLTVWPADQPRPTISQMNWVAGQTGAGQVTVRLAATTGRISVFTNAVRPVIGQGGPATNDDDAITACLMTPDEP